MLPGGLPGHDQVQVVAAEDRCEYQEEEQEHEEDREDSLDVLPLPPISITI